MVIKAYTERYNAYDMFVEVLYLDAPTEVSENRMEEIIFYSLKEKKYIIHPLTKESTA